MNLSHSRIQTFQQCQRRYRYGYVDGYRPVAKAQPLRFGSLMHDALETWWRAVGLGDHNALHQALYAMAYNKHVADPFDLALARTLIAGYHCRWIDEASRSTVLAVEEDFDLAIGAVDGHDIHLRGRVDVLIENEQGTFVFEHKTTASIDPGSPFWRQLRLAPQATAYYLGAEAILGRPVDGCVYDVLGKPGTKPSKATANPKFRKDGQPYANTRLADETPEEFEVRLLEVLASDPDTYFQRQLETRLADECDAFRAQLHAVARQIDFAHHDGGFPMNPEACFGPFGRSECPFFCVCSREQSIDDPFLFYRADGAEELIHASDPGTEA